MKFKITELAVIHPAKVNDLAARAKFWDDVAFNLAPHNADLSCRMQQRLYRQLARVVLPLTDEEQHVLEEQRKVRAAELAKLPKMKLYPKKP
jgi:hypothetical protein